MIETVPQVFVPQRLVETVLSSGVALSAGVEVDGGIIADVSSAQRQTGLVLRRLPDPLFAGSAIEARYIIEEV